MKEKGKRRWREEEKRRKESGRGGWWGLDGAGEVGMLAGTERWALASWAVQKPGQCWE